MTTRDGVPGRQHRRGSRATAVNPPLELVPIAGGTQAGARCSRHSLEDRRRFDVPVRCLDRGAEGRGNAVIASSSADVLGTIVPGGLRPTSFGDAFFARAMRKNDDFRTAFRGGTQATLQSARSGARHVDGSCDGRTPEGATSARERPRRGVVRRTVVAAGKSDAACRASLRAMAMASFSGQNLL